MDYYRRRLMEPIHGRPFGPSEDELIDIYMERMHNILSAYPSIGVPPEPSPISTGVFVGTTANGENLALLRSLRIDYVLNCGCLPSRVHHQRARKLYRNRNSGVKDHLQLCMEDDDETTIGHWVRKATQFIQFARSHSGRVIICSPGVSRSGTIAIAYLIHKGVPILSATQILKTERRVALCNESFMRQLIEYARLRGELGHELTTVQPREFGTRLDHYRILSASMPAID